MRERTAIEAIFPPSVRYFLILSSVGGRYGTLLPLLRIVGLSHFAFSFSRVGPVAIAPPAFSSALRELQPAGFPLFATIPQTAQ
jgi:hypothetical protein